MTIESIYIDFKKIIKSVKRVADDRVDRWFVSVWVYAGVWVSKSMNRLAPIYNATPLKRQKDRSTDRRKDG